MIFVRIVVVYGVFCSVERLDLRHSELFRKGEVQHPGGEWRFSLLHRGIHGDWSSAFYRYLHVVDFLLDVLEPLLPRPLLIAILSGGLVRIMLPSVASFPFSIRFSTRVEVLLFSGNRVLVFSGLLCLLGASYLSGELFQLFQQVLVGDAESFHLVRVGLHYLQRASKRSVVHSAWLVLHPWRIGVAPACVSS